MTTSSLDMRYGRQGGRIVPWVAQPRRFEAGSPAVLLGHRVEVVNDEIPGRRYAVRFANGAELVVHELALEELIES